MVLVCCLFFVGCDSQKADDIKQNSVSTTNNNSITGEAVSGVGVDAETENNSDEEDMEFDDEEEEPDNYDEIVKWLEKDIERREKRKKRLKKYAELINGRSYKRDIIKAKWAEPIHDNFGKHDNPKNVKNIELEGYKWDSKETDFSIKMKSYKEDEEYEGAEYLPFDENFKTVLSRNKEYMVGTTIYRDDKNKLHKAVRYFKNDNSYVIYEANSYYNNHNILHLESQIATIACPGEAEIYIRFPFPSCRDIDEYDVERSWEKDKDCFSNRLLRCFSIKELKEFYSDFSEGIAIYDKEKKIFKIKGKISRLMDVYVYLDFKHMTIKVVNEEGKEVVSSKSFDESVCLQYNRLGKIGDKTFYNNGLDEFVVVKNGKRKHVIDAEKGNDLFEFTGWNCVGESYSLKFAKESTNNNVVITFIMVLEEDVEWRIKGKLYFDRDGNYKKIKFMKS